jgi:FkbM family methyltransferase
MDYIKFDKKPNLFRVDVSLEIDEIIEKEEMPLKFRVEDWLTSHIYYEANLDRGWWASYDNTGFKNFCVYTKSGKILKKLQFDPYNDVSKIEEAFNIWISSRKRSKGLVLGAGNGRWGEWLMNVVNNDCSAVLVEGDPNNHKALEVSHKSRSNVKIENCVVSPNGGKVKFWIAPQNMVSSLNVDVVKKFFPESDPEFVEVESKTINQIIKENFTSDLDWIRIDLEGLDHEIIMGLDPRIVPNLKMVLFENMNISSFEYSDIKNKLSNMGFSNFIDIGIDTICTKK